MKSTTIICSVPDERKALAVKKTMEQQVSNLIQPPSSNCIPIASYSRKKNLPDRFEKMYLLIEDGNRDNHTGNN